MKINNKFRNLRIAKKLIETLIVPIKHCALSFDFFLVLNSPFKRLKLKFYFGEIKRGTPHFLPRKWVKSKEKPGYINPVQIKHFGINIVGLGYKTKWSDDDYRFEWNPMISIVIFGKQFVIYFLPNIPKDCYPDVYWEKWLFYRYQTNKNGSTVDRLKELYKKESCTYTIYSKDEKTTINYYPSIIKQKWLKKSNYSGNEYVNEQDNEVE